MEELRQGGWVGLEVNLHQKWPQNGTSNSDHGLLVANEDIMPHKKIK